MEKATLHVCPDETISSPQPVPEFSGYEGKCGQTAAANITTMMCGKHVSPKGVEAYGAYDLTPGSQPKTLKKTLKKLFSERQYTALFCPKGEWSVVKPETSNEFLLELKATLYWSKFPNANPTASRNRGVYSVLIQPTPVLLKYSLTNWHWVTVVDVIPNEKDKYECSVVYNMEGDQYISDCESFTDNADTSTLGMMGYRLLRFTPAD
ncbi:MAG: hypothetical protein KA715_12350 [Xanthomonadaceae bacterium]|nr:hypothetical protein [Xanthomonadaceae bacterium]